MWQSVKPVFRMIPWIRREMSTFAIPGTSAAYRESDILQGNFVQKYQWIHKEFLHGHDVRSWDIQGGETGFEEKSAREFPSQGENGEMSALDFAEKFLGSRRFCGGSTLCSVFGPFQDLITMFLLKTDDVDHPILHFTNAVVKCREIEAGKGVNSHALTKAMTILLVSEMYGLSDGLLSAPSEFQRAVKDKQDLVAKIGEIAWVTHELHRKILDVSALLPRLSFLYPGASAKATALHLQDWHRANKTAALIGDLLLTRKCAHLAALKSSITLGLLCNSLAHFCESEFELQPRGRHGIYDYESYLNRTELGLGSLMGHCMYSALLFSGFSDPVRQEAFKLGSRLGILFQTYNDIQFFSKNGLGLPRWLDTGLLPVVLQMKSRPDILQKPHPVIFDIVKGNTDTMRASLQVFRQVQESVLQHIASNDKVQNPVSQKILINFIESLSPGEEI